MKRVAIEENSEVLKFFRKNHGEEAGMRGAITAGLPAVLSDKPYKIKTVRNCRYLGKTIFEYKAVNPETGFSCRAAFVSEGETVTVFFISEILYKKDFARLIEKHKGVKKS